MVIDLFGLTAEEVRARFPAVYQWVYERVKPERDQNNRDQLPQRTGGYSTANRALPCVQLWPDCRATSPPSKPPNTASSSFSTRHPAGQQADQHRAGRRLLPGRALQPHPRDLGAGRRKPPRRRQRSGLRQDRLLREIPLPRRHRRAAGAHPRPGRAVGRAPQAPAGPAPQADPDRHVQRAGEAAGRRAADRQGQDGPRAGAGQRAAGNPRRAGRGRVRRVRLAGRRSPTRRSWRGWSPSTPSAPPRKRRVSSAGCGPSTRRPPITHHVSRSTP